MSAINQAVAVAASPAPEGISNRRSLPRRDIFLLPALSLLTVITMIASAEIYARLVWPFDDLDACLVQDPVHGMRYRPNCHSRVRVPETPWVYNSYNECGYRTRESCGPKPPGTVRVAVLGSSFSFGFRNAYAQAYTSIAGDALTRRLRRHVEFQNLGVQEYSILNTYRRMDQALALKPDLIVLGLTPIDIRKYIDPGSLAARNEPESSQTVSKTEPEISSLRKYVIGPLDHSRALYMLQHFLYQDPQSYLNLYLLSADNSGYLRKPFSPAWQQRFSTLDLMLGDMASKAQSASVPLVLLIGPQPANVALINTHPRPGIDPYAFVNQVTAIAHRHGIPTIDPLPEMGGRSDPMSLFYVVDGHLDQNGQRIVADALDEWLCSSGLPAFAARHGN